MNFILTGDPLIVNLLLPQRWTHGLSVPLKLVLVIQSAAFIGDRDDLATVSDLLFRDTCGIRRDPQQWGRTVDLRGVIRIACDLVTVEVIEVKHVIGHNFAQRRVVAMSPWLEELGEEARLLSAGGGAGGGWAIQLALRLVVAIFVLGAGPRDARSCLRFQPQRALLMLETSRQVVKQRVEGTVDSDMEESSEDCENNH